MNNDFRSGYSSDFRDVRRNLEGLANGGGLFQRGKPEREERRKMAYIPVFQHKTYIYRVNIQLDAQRQYVVIGTLALLFVLNCFKLFYVSRAAAGKGAMSVVSSFHAWLEAQKSWL